jgi:biotin-dependent carboxylase-like uncharacterized protein
MIEVVRQGLLTTVQDLGRVGYAHLGVGRAGALDAPALRLANRLAGNPDGAAGLETTLTGVSFRAEVTMTVAVTGARAAITVDGAAVEFGAAFAVPEGAVVDVGRAETGVRSYVAVTGGITVAPVLGSRSTDTLSGLGPPPLRTGFVLPIGTTMRGSRKLREMSSTDGSPVTAVPDSTPASRPGGGAVGEIRVRVRLGPRHDWFNLTARDTLVDRPYTLSVKSNRVGARLSGPILNRAVGAELPSEGIVLGAIQVPADGQPLVFLADHPTTGGYPVIAVVAADDLPLVAQARPGTTVRFAPWT